ncbi:unnamed protein product [Cyprideis torosa]|uniref:Uncharacterized protein n=1 Tax=Cyprideis torosa TaxID=163714 RepID=A0A7R8ZPH0_9CRUS|nr:unnamed protein product [Cyprideis torosa]CAG0888368.1 unnamed protein product [Cyprideis torosa]
MARPKTLAFSTEGAYRRIVVKPSDVSHRLVSYQNDEAILLPSMFHPGEGFDIPPGDKWALVVEFSLPVHAFATMALREITLFSFEKWRPPVAAEDQKSSEGPKEEPEADSTMDVLEDGDEIADSSGNLVLLE